MTDTHHISIDIHEHDDVQIHRVATFFYPLNSGCRELVVFAFQAFASTEEALAEFDELRKRHGAVRRLLDIDKLASPGRELRGLIRGLAGALALTTGQRPRLAIVDGGHARHETCSPERQRGLSRERRVVFINFN